jgi:hypothetical protein
MTESQPKPTSNRGEQPKKIPRAKLDHTARYTTWTALDRSSATRTLLHDLLRFFNLKERELSREFFKQTGKIPTQPALCSAILAVDISEWGSATWSTRRLDDYLSLLEVGSELGII